MKETVDEGVPCKIKAADFDAFHAKEIAPLVKQIERVCQENGLSMLVVTEAIEPEEDGMWCRSTDYATGPSYSDEFEFLLNACDVVMQDDDEEAEGTKEE
jgi:hypothetical protein